MSPSRLLLLLEDDPGLRTQLTWFLADTFEVETAGDSEGARALLERLADDPDGVSVALVDLHLPPRHGGVPALAGLELMAYIRLHWPRCRIVAYSADGNGSLSAQAQQAGANLFLGKPVDPDRLSLALTGGEPSPLR